ncbi:MAG: hypothetical protein QOF09_4569 [Alphaproteobacteria bacterium]|jgi:uncharacterized protein (DUF488 family)|nr:hypothetical protein [Alphaproteobacteria bacterium]
MAKTPEVKAKTKAVTKAVTKTKPKAKSASKLFTIGYEKAKPAAVMAELKRAKVTLLVDTRAVAASRKPGFSKKQLAAGLDEEGIGYLHLQKLGTPDEGRQAAHTGKMEVMWRIYAKHLKTPDAIEAMDELVSIVKSGQSVCLLCFERDKNCCHRSRIAEIVHERTGANVVDLVPALF